MALTFTLRSGMTLHWTRGRRWLVVFLAVVGAVYSWAGVAMNASFAAAAETPAAEANHRHAVYVFAAIMLLCIVIGVSALVALWRDYRRSRPAI